MQYATAATKVPSGKAMEQCALTSPALACYAVAVTAMSQIARIFTTSAVLFLVMSTPALAAEIKDVKLPQDKLPGGCKAVDGKFPVDVQTAILYDEYTIYKGLLPELADKQVQSFECGGEKASLYFFQYKSSNDRTKAEDFIRTLLWGEDKPSRQHPELIQGYENILVIVSARKTAEKLGHAVDDQVATLKKK